ncbi:ATP-binding cassette domain-containing protein [Fusobacterium sp. SYSU M8A802]
MVNLFKGNKKVFIFLFGLLLFISCFRVLPIYFIEKIIDLASTSNIDINQENIYKIIKIGFFFILVNTFKSFLFSVSKWFSENNQAKISTNLKILMFEKFSKVKFEYLNKINISSISLSIIEDSEKVGENIITLYSEIILSFFTFLFGIYFFSRINFLLIIYVFPPVLILILILNKISQKIKLIISVSKIKLINVLGLFNDGILGIKTLKVHQVEKDFLEKIKKDSFSLQEIKIKQAELKGINFFFSDITFIISFGITLIIASIFVKKNYLTIGELTAILMYNHLLTDPILKLIELYPKIIEILNCLKRIEEIKIFPEEKEKIYGKVNKIELKAITIKFGENIVQSDINLIINSSFGIFGESGKGKSSLLNIISGLIEPKIGEVYYYFDDKKVNYFPKVSYMMQDDFIFNMSLKDNILLGSKNITENEYKEILKICNLEYLDFRYKEKNIGKNGGTLSGGEKTRIKIARALANKEADIFLFDEISAGIDNDNLLNIFNNIESFLIKQNKIRVYVDHSNYIKKQLHNYIFIN